MKKKLLTCSPGWGMCKHFLRIMKLTVLISLCFVFCVSASTYSQTTKLSLNLVNSTIKEVLNQVEEKSDFVFLYKIGELDENKRVNIVLENASVREILDQVLIGQSLTYDIYNRQIIIRKVIGDNFLNPQPRSVSGKVTDSSGLPLPGVSIVIKGKSTGTTSDFDGNYTLEISEDAATLVFSFVGMKSQEITIGKRTQISVSLEEATIGLDEVVAVGYGVRNKRDVTTSIASVKSEDLQDIPVAGFDQALIGKMAGVQVLQTTGEPGRETDIRVRGVGSISAGNEPLFVVDGLPLDVGGQAIETVNMNDVESIEILKDASAAAIYGSRGSNGVMLITTKRGNDGKLQISYDGSYGIQQVSKKIDMLNAYQYAELSRDGHNNAYLDAVPTGSVDDPNEVRSTGWMKIPDELVPYLKGKPGLTDTDWQDEIFRTAPIQKHSISFAGGTPKVKYFISGNYTKQDGVVINSDYSKYGVRFNLDVNSGKVHLGVNFSPSYTCENRITSNGPYSDEGVIGSALQSTPIWPVYNDDGSYNFDGNGYLRIGTDYQHNEVLNPVALANEVQRDVYHTNLLGNAFFEYEIIDGLKYKLSLGATANHYHMDYYRPSILPLRGWQYYTDSSNPTATASSTSKTNWSVENNLFYDKQIGKHNVSAMAGYSAQKNYSNNHWATATDFPNDLVTTLNAGVVIDGESEITEWSLLSLIGRLQYSYNGKYLFSAAIRSDGSSRFGDNNKWGNFPSVSAGWRMNEESFMKGIKFVTHFKLRASYGLTGNFQIGNYEHIARLSKDDYILGSANGQQVGGLTPSNVENSDLGWEKTAMLDFGADLTLFKNKLSLEVDWYSSNTTDLLLNVPVPLTTGFSTARQNIGEVNNRGWEANLTSRQKFGELSWTASVNFSANRNEVKALGPENTPIIETAGTGTTFFITQVGKPIGSYYLLVQDGVFKNKEELDKYPHFSDTQPGDFKFVDVDKNGKLDVNKDRAIAGNYFPDFTYGFSSGFKYKGLDFSVNFQGVQGNEIINLIFRFINSMEGNFNNMTDALDRWKSEDNPGDGNTNRANRKNKGNTGRTSTWHVEDASYLRLQNITLGYTLPKKLITKVKLEKVRLYVSGQNLYTWTKYSGYNPEVNLYDSNALTPGVDYGTYPLPRTISVGANITF